MDKKRKCRKDFIGEMVKIEVQENFTEIIKLFSKYLTYMNENYMYNETYLESFCCEFLEFKKYVELKNQVAVRMYQTFLGRVNDLQLEIFIDQCWHCSEMNFGVAKKIDRNKVCRDKIEIRGKLEIDQKEYIFIKEYSVIKNGTLIQEEINKMVQELKKWVEENRNE